MQRHPELLGEPDDALVRAYQDDRDGPRGREAAAVLFGRWRLRAYQWARRFVHEHEQALDIAQDCLMQAFEALPRYDARGRFSAWLFAIVHNRCRGAVRRRPLVRDPDADTDLLVSGVPGPEDEFESAERERQLLERIGRVLEPHERAALWMRSVEGLSVDDITRLLELDGASGARGVLQTARRKLRAAFRPGPGAGGDT